MASWRFWRTGRADDQTPYPSDEWCELVTVPSFEAPLLVADLGQHGITATSIEAFSLVTRVASDARVLVRRSELDTAQAVLVARSG